MEELLKRMAALEFALYGQAAGPEGKPPDVVSSESIEGRLRDAETVAHSAEGEVIGDEEAERRRPRIEDDLAAARRIEGRVVAREPAPSEDEPQSSMLDF